MKDKLLISRNGRHIRRCKQCGISEAYPDIIIARDGSCSQCDFYEEHRQAFDAYFGSPSELNGLLSETSSSTGYDCLLLFSGGKDSTYALARLVDSGSKVLALTLDNGFISPEAIKNAKRTTESLKADHEVVTLPTMQRVFRDSLFRTNSVCKGCFNVVLTTGLLHAYRAGIRFVVTGLSRGQIAEERLAPVVRLGYLDRCAIERALEDGRYIHHASERYDGAPSLGPDLENILQNTQVIDFFRYHSATRREVVQTVNDMRFWRTPIECGACSTNCLLNDAGIVAYSEATGYHYYEGPTAWDVRLGVLTLEEAMADLQPPPVTSTIREQLESLGYSLGDQNVEQSN